MRNNASHRLFRLLRGSMTAAAFAIAAAHQASAATPAQQVTGYYVCVLNASTDGGKTETVFLSDVIPNTGFRPGQITGFREFVAATYNAKGLSQCFERGSEADARDYMKTTAPGQKKVMTGWKFSGASAAQRSQPSSPTQPAAPPSTSDKVPYGSSAPSGALQGLCYSYANSRLFIARLFDWGNRPPSEHVDDDFREYVMKTYGTPPGTSVRCAAGPPPNAAHARQTEIDQARQSRREIVEFDWAPPAKPAAAVPAPTAPAPTRTVPATPPATKPAPSTPPAAKPAATPAPAKPAPQEPAMYSYCYAYGPAVGRGAKQHFYITQPFQLAASDRPNQDFEKFLRTAHAGEAVSVSCLSPGPLDAAQKNRQQTLDLKRKQAAQWDVVEVDWKRE